MGDNKEVVTMSPKDGEGKNEKDIKAYKGHHAPNYKWLTDAFCEYVLHRPLID